MHQGVFLLYKSSRREPGWRFTAGCYISMSQKATEWHSSVEEGDASIARRQIPLPAPGFLIKGYNREAEEKHTFMLSAEGNSAAGVGGRPRIRATIYDRRAVFSKLCLIYTVEFFPTNFTLFSELNYNGWYLWFVGLCAGGWENYADRSPRAG